HPQKTGMTDPLFQRTADGQVYYYQNDHLGTPQRLIKSNGAIVWRATYTAFGEASVDADSTVENNLRFPGQYYDQETGLHQNYFRDYDPETGRYIQTDPIGLEGGLNTYGYAQADPITSMDPLGLKSGGRSISPRRGSRGEYYSQLSKPRSPRSVGNFLSKVRDSLSRRLLKNLTFPATNFWIGQIFSTKKNWPKFLSTAHQNKY